mmetsp:Transcript_53074/g.164463  ORF Transcript_53074/g.164463 Transcript_53074/m.164463 type:complete len:242 (-) Transcript_53074:594-1319(-)
MPRRVTKSECSARPPEYSSQESAFRPQPISVKTFFKRSAPCWSTKMCSCSRVTLLTLTVSNMASMKIPEMRFNKKNCPKAAKAMKITPATAVLPCSSSGRTIFGPHSSPRSRTSSRVTMVLCMERKRWATPAGRSSLLTEDTGPIRDMTKSEVTRMRRKSTTITERKVTRDCQTASSIVCNVRKISTARTSFTARVSLKTRKIAKKEPTSPCPRSPRGSRTQCSTAESVITMMSKTKKWSL